MTGSGDIMFILTKEDIIACAREMGIAEEAITDDVLYHIRKGVQSGLENCTEVVKTAIRYALKEAEK